MAQPIKVDNVDVVLYTDVRRVNHGIGGKEVMHVDDFHVAPGARANTNGERAGARSNDECPDVKWRACTGNTVHGGRNFVTRWAAEKNKYILTCRGGAPLVMHKGG
ncbi:hypothetical protein BKA82DRAFT_30794 [Pisolithus tinctorius]|uniref:Uncharacterized protein n=1 Tax=Pisolithus tinctorius Marx 270 TaxID=870435 RepID=A0A0C3NU74_PISTI|nr:hypothetical protein BKA82DRAFT_30794 [Pisolithus tinctorius]KIN98990.1 hypothetical protein M404DRAFT_30794 [Pisolithus tinctorius Marx 270]